MDSINEARVDNLIDQIVRFGTDSDTQLKRACLRAALIVGKYDPYATANIAERMRRHVSTVENWAHAGCLFLELRQSPVARLLWRKLPASHWWLALSIQKSGYNALRYLHTAYVHSWSGRVMMQEFRKDMEAGNAPMQISRAVIAFRGLADELLKSNSLTDEQIDALLKIQEVFQ